MKYNVDMNFGKGKKFRHEFSTFQIAQGNLIFKILLSPDPHNLEVYVHLKIGNMIEISFHKQYLPENLRFFAFFHFYRSSKFCHMGGSHILNLKLVQESSSVGFLKVLTPNTQFL